MNKLRNLIETELEAHNIAIMKMIDEAFQGPTTDAPAKPNPAKVKVLLDPGHSSGRPGASTHDKKKYEHNYTPYMATLIKTSLEATGKYIIDIYDPEIDNLTQIGLKAKGYNMFISIHLNAYDRDYEDEYTCVCTHREQATTRSNNFASRLAVSIVKEIDNPIFRPNSSLKGVYKLGLGVLRAAESVCDGPCVLSESFFIDAHDDKAATVKRCQSAALGHVKAIRDWFGV